MDSQWMNEQELIYTSLVNSSGAETSEQEDVLDWIKSIGSGAAQGAGTGIVAGPWGALIGGLAGAGLGALQQATQRQPAPPPRPPAPSQPATPPSPATGSGGDSAVQQFAQILPQLLQLLQRPAPQGLPASPASPISTSPPSTLPTSSSSGSAGAATAQFAQILPQLLQLVQAIQPQSQGHAREDIDEGGNVESLAGDMVPDSAFASDQAVETPDTGDDEHIEFPEPVEPVQPRLTGGLLFPSSNDFFAQLTAPRTLTFPSEWATETESAAMVQPVFQWVG